jgi:hypothetical protein
MKKSLLKLFFCLVAIAVATLSTTDWAIAQSFPHPNSLVAQTSITSPAPKDQQPLDTTVPTTPKSSGADEQPVESPDQQTSDRRSMTAPSASPSTPLKSEPNGPYDTKAIEEFYKSLYGS